MSDRKSARKTAPRSRANAEAKKPGRVSDATELATLDLRAEACRLFVSGESVPDIAKQLNRSTDSIYLYIADTRLDLIRSKKEHYDKRLALHLDDSFDALAVNARLLADRDWLTTADPLRINEISKAFGIISDKCFVLLAAAGRGRTFATTGPEGAEAVPV